MIFWLSITWMESFFRKSSVVDEKPHHLPTIVLVE